MMTTTMNSLRRTYMVTMIATATDRRTGKKVGMEIPMDVPQRMVDAQLWNYTDYQPLTWTVKELVELNPTLYKWIYQQCKMNMSLMGYQINTAIKAEFYSTAYTYVVTECQEEFLWQKQKNGLKQLHLK